MYAVIEQGGKQYKVAKGESINIELADVAPDAKTIEMDKVLFVADGDKIQVGKPYIDGAKVVANFQKTAEDSVIKGKKLYPMHFKRRKGKKRKMGHRQKYMKVTIDEIKA